MGTEGASVLEAEVGVYSRFSYLPLPQALYDNSSEIQNTKICPQCL